MPDPAMAGDKKLRLHTFSVMCDRSLCLVF